MINELRDLPFGVRDFIYLENEKIIFVALSDMNIASRIDAYITNTNFPWEKKTESHVTVGAIICFKVKDVKGNTSYEKLWLITYPVQIGCMAWDESTNTLNLGFDDGKIICYKVSSEFEYRQYDKFAEIQAHKERVMGIAMESRTGYIYSVGSDEKLVTSETNYQEKVTGSFLIRNVSGNSRCQWAYLRPAESKIIYCDGKG